MTVMVEAAGPTVAKDVSLVDDVRQSPREAQLEMVTKPERSASFTNDKVPVTVVGYHLGRQQDMTGVAKLLTAPSSACFP